VNATSLADWVVIGGFLGGFIFCVLWLAWARRQPPASSSRGEEAKPKERNDKQHECAEGPNCDFCRGMEAYIASDVRREMDARLRSSTVAVNMALADIAEHEPDVRLIERMVLAEEGQQ
jgi:hypothetical protein